MRAIIHSVVIFLGWVAVASPLAGSPIRQLYVEPFTTRAHSEKLREDVIAELRKLGSISLAASESRAEAVLEGGGEIWVKGYQSLNPRSGRLPSDGVPIYDGYLAVELKDMKGQTFWSYLVTPGSATQNVSRDLAKKIAKHVAEALEQGEPASKESPLPAPNTILTGAGATFPDPVYAKWFTNYRREDPNLQINYEAIGTEAGIRKLVDGTVDFGASDSPEAIRDIAPAKQYDYLLFPSVVGAVVPIVNLPGFSEQIDLTAEALAGIYLGKIKNWNDPVLRRANRGKHLPDLPIVVVHRAEGSGTSYAWTNYLSAASPEWKARVGVGLAPDWPAGKAANGNDGVAKLVKELGGSIGYVEFIYALQNHLSYARVQNHHGEFVGASLESMSVAVSEAVKMTDDFKGSLVNAPAAGAYPISSFTWLVVPAHLTSEAKQNAMKSFLRWMLGTGQAQAAALGYLALPKELIGREEAAIVKME